MRARMAQHSPYPTIARARHPLEAATDETELVIDGFPRTGTTFAVVAFHLAQHGLVRVSHHIHSAAHLLAASRRATPTLGIIREPRDTAVSCVIREPYVTLRQALWAYAVFYTALNELGDRVVVGDFGDITTDIGGVIDRVNDRFGTSFARFVNTPHTTAECFRIIDDRARRPPWDDHIGAFLAGTEDIHQLRRARQEWQAHHPDRLPIPEDRVARPSQSRQRTKARLRRNYASAELAATRTRAEHAYTRFLRAARRTQAVLVAIGLSTEWCRLVPG